MREIDASVCPICGQSIENTSNECGRCSFNSNTRTIADTLKLQACIKQLKSSWLDEVMTKRRLVDNLPCSISQAARLIGEKKSLISLHVKLARAIERHPELTKCKNKDAARRQLEQIEKGATPTGSKPKFDFETDLQQYLYENWEHTEFSKDWRLVSSMSGTLGRYPTGDVGEIDLLARGKASPDWLVIELKRDLSSDLAVGQLLRYMGWVKSNLAEGDEIVHGRIICAAVDESLYYALSCVPNAKVLVYERKDNNVVFSSPEQAIIAKQLTLMSLEQKKAFLKASLAELRNMDDSE